MAVGIEVASVRVACTRIAFGRVCTSAGVACAHLVARSIARMRRKGRGDGISFPDVHLGTACAVISHAGILIVGGWLPSFDVTLEDK